jgi:8-oxo-dGTP pyrophosphatase MutT (NUDIX family)
MSPFLRHIAACNDAVLPGGRLPFRLAETRVGWVRPDFAAVLADLPGIVADDAGVTLADPAALPALARALADRGLFRHRGEAFDVRAVPGGQVLSTIDRGALPAFGVMAEGIHGNGLVRRADGLQVWIARRAADKALDPGKLDHIVAGGMPAGLTPGQTLVKEAAEEAAIPAALAQSARPVATITYAMDRPEGLRRDILHCYDIDLPESFLPHAADGEVESFALWPIARVLEAVRDTDDFKFNVNLVLIDLFLRQGLLAGAEARALRAALDAGRVALG